VGAVNWLLMIVTVGLTIGFGKSDNLAAAYGIAVSATMLMTSVLLFIAMREVWRWSLPAAGALAGIFLIVDAAFFSANLVKVAEGGYVPLLLAGCVYFIMVVWHVGAVAVSERLHETLMPIENFLAKVREAQIPRVPGTAVFLTRTQRDAPPVLVWHLKHNRSLHERLFILTVETESIPRMRGAAQLIVSEIAPNFWRARARYGFMERPDIPALLREARARGCKLSLDDVTYYVGHETVVHREDRKRVPHWLERLFAFLQRNSVHVSDFFRLPPDEVVEIGRQISI
jgi:KUP system potassium uptake protein